MYLIIRSCWLINRGITALKSRQVFAVHLCFRSFHNVAPAAERCGRLLRFQSRLYPSKMVITVPNCMILEQKLARERSIRVERHWSGLVKLLVCELPNCGRGYRAVAPEELQSCVLRNGICSLACSAFIL